MNIKAIVTTAFFLLVMMNQSARPEIELKFNPDIFNPLYFKIRDCKSRIVLNKGGAGSGKSYAAAQNEVVKSLQSTQKTLVIRKEAVTLKDSVIPLIKDSIIGKWGLSEFFEYNKTDRELTNVFNGSKFLFRGLDDPEKLKSIEGITRVFIEELTNLEEADFNELLRRLRGMNDQQFVACFNPISEYIWIKPRFFDTRRDYVTIFESTYKDNRFLDQAYIDLLEDSINTNPRDYQVYVKNEWGIEDKSNKFAYNYNEEIHTGEVELTDDPYLYLSFDFNVDPITCMVAQIINEQDRILEVIKLHNSDIYQMCDYINTNYPNRIYLVTGDATGRNRSALVKDKVNYYIIIRDKLQLNDAQIMVPSVNPPIVENKVLVNACLKVVDTKIHPVKAKALHEDLKYGEVDNFNKLVKDSRTKTTQQLDALDCYRYHCNTHHRQVLDRLKIKAA